MPTLAERVCPVGDLNDDGYSDLLIGIVVGPNVSGGSAYILFGGEDMDELVDATILHTDVGAAGTFANFVSPAGDMDGDGYDEVLIGTSGHSALTSMS